MAAGPLTQIADIIVPRKFTSYVTVLTEKKSRLIQSGAMQTNALLSQNLAGGGLIFDFPFFKDLDDDSDRVSTDTPAERYTGGSADPDPFKITTGSQVAVRMSRNGSWSSADLASALAGVDPLDAIQNLVAAYRARRLQAAFIATMTGIFADNDASPGGSEHVQGDLTLDVSGVGFVDGVTNFSAEAYLDAKQTMGDSQEALDLTLVHSVVYNRMKKNNLIDFIPDAEGRVNIPTFMGGSVIVDDSMPASAGVYHTWLFGRGAVQFGSGDPKVPTEVERHPGAGNGGGQEVLWNRWEWCIHPVGHKYAGSAASGGPSNANTSNNLAHAGSWQRVYPERKQIAIARLITREA